jgi:hypothetical protein
MLPPASYSVGQEAAAAASCVHCSIGSFDSEGTGLDLMSSIHPAMSWMLNSHCCMVFPLGTLLLLLQRCLAADSPCTRDGVYSGDSQFAWPWCAGTVFEASGDWRLTGHTVLCIVSQCSSSVRYLMSAGTAWQRVIFKNALGCELPVYHASDLVMAVPGGRIEPVVTRWCSRATYSRAY